jgi:hypothetical protein
MITFQQVFGAWYLLPITVNPDDDHYANQSSIEKCTLQEGSNILVPKETLDSSSVSFS